MANKNRQIAEDVLKAVGGEENVTSLTHCITRLRFKLKDEGIPDDDEVQKINGVIKVMHSAGQYQVVVGQNVNEVYDEVLKMSSIKGTAASSAEADKADAKKQKPLDKVVDIISGIFMPFMGAFTGAGVLKGFLVLFTTMGWLDKTGTTYAILNAAGDGVFYFLPIFLAYCAGQKFGAKPFMSMAIAAAMCYPTITTLYSGGDAVTFLGIPVKLISYTSSVLPIILTCFVQAQFEKLLNKIVPALIRSIIVPIATLVVLVPLAFIIIGPVTDWVGSGMAFLVNKGIETVPWLAGFAMASLWPIMIIFGVHWGFVPVALNNLATLGYDYIMPLTVGCNFGIAAAAFAVFLKTRNKELKQTAGAATISAFIGGVTEPAVYGVLLKYKKPMVIVCLVNGVAGAICGMFHVTRDVQMSVNALTLPAIWAVYGPWAIVAIVVALVGSFVLTWMFGYKNETESESVPEPELSRKAI